MNIRCESDPGLIIRSCILSYRVVLFARSGEEVKKKEEEVVGSKVV